MEVVLGVLVYCAVSALLSGGLLVLVWLADRFDREPIGMVLLAAGWGTLPAVFLSCLLEFAVQLPLAALAGGDGKALEPLMSVAVAPSVEEGVKALALFGVVLFRRREFDDVMDGLVYGAAVGIGFSFVEDLVYFVSAIGHDGLGAGVLTFLLRNLGFALNHSLFTALTGIGFGLARQYHRTAFALFAWPAAGLLAAVALHACHNALALLALPGLMGALYLHLVAGLSLTVLVFLLWGVEQRWIARHLSQEVAEGSIPAAALEALPFLHRPGGAAPRRGRELRSALQRLAFHRRQVDEGWSPESAEELETFRAIIRKCLGG